MRSIIFAVGNSKNKVGSDRRDAMPDMFIWAAVFLVCTNVKQQNKAMRVRNYFGTRFAAHQRIVFMGRSSSFAAIPHKTIWQIVYLDTEYYAKEHHNRGMKLFAIKQRQFWMMYLSNSISPIRRSCNEAYFSRVFIRVDIEAPSADPKHSHDAINVLND